MITLSEYFKDTNAETAFMLGKYCGLRINECYGLKWCNLDIISLTLIDDNTVQITFKGGGTRRVNIEADSHSAIILDVMKHVY